MPRVASGRLQPGMAYTWPFGPYLPFLAPRRRTPDQPDTNLTVSALHCVGARKSSLAPCWKGGRQNHYVRPDSSLAFFACLRYQPPMANESLDKLAKRLAETVPEGLRSVREDLEKNFRSVLQTGLGRLDLVTREEFEVQEAVLARAREKLDSLEARLADMESAPASKKSGAKKTAKKAGKAAGKKSG